MINPKKKADSDPAGQPFFLSKGSSKQVYGEGRRFWVIAGPLLLLLLIVIGVKYGTSNQHVPPALQLQGQARPSAAATLMKRGPLQPRIPEPQIRVNVTPGGTESFELEVRGAYRLSVLDSTRELPIQTSLKRIVVSATTKGLKLGTTQTTETQLEIVPEESPSVRIDGHLYRGRMRLFRRTDGKVSAVNVLPIEEYLASVVDSEMPAKFPEAARQAQAIVARTYALYQIQQANPKSVFDLMSSQRSQKYLGVEYIDKAHRRLAGESESSRRATRSTRGVICNLNDQLFCTYYSAVCGGKTIDGKEVFKDATAALKSTRCEWCRESPYYRWTTELPLDVFEARTLSRSEKGIPLGIQSIQQTVDPGDGRICQFKLNSREQHLLLDGVQLRDRLPTGTLLSPHFHVVLENDKVTFKGRGHGHGVGFCQWGAKGMAEAGHNYAEIVHHYFDGVKLTTLNY